MSQRCTHTPKLLKCSNQPCCKRCIIAYQSLTHCHLIESTNYPESRQDRRSLRAYHNESHDLTEPAVTESPEEKFLRTLIEKEQTNTSEILEYLDVIQGKLANHIEAMINDIKAEVAANSCAQNKHIQGLLTHRNNENFSEIVASFRAAEEPTHKISIDEKMFVDTLKDVIKQMCRRSVSPKEEGEQIMVDFLDSRTMRWIKLEEKGVMCEYKDITGDFVLFPHSRYCFINTDHIISTGGQENNYAIHNSYLLSTSSMKSCVLPQMIYPRSHHAVCLYQIANERFLYVFGGSTSPSVEKLELSPEMLAYAGNALSFAIEDANSPHWMKQRDLQCILETASCVQHSDFIYVTGSNPTTTLKVIKYNPREADPNAAPDVQFDFLGEVVRYPCALCAWHTQVVVLYTDGRQHFARRWTIGTPCTKKGAEEKLDLAGKGVSWAPVCPPITKDSNCYLLVETDRGTVLVCYNFIQKQTTFPKLTTITH